MSAIPSSSDDPNSCLPSSLRLPGRTLAVPSWVFPGSIEDNCHFLSGKVDEVGLLFFESRQPEPSLPKGLAGLPLSWHVHLPLDLSISQPAQAARTCSGLLNSAAFLGPLKAVLHPPPLSMGLNKARAWMESFLQAFTHSGGDPGLLLLENVKDNDLLPLEGIISLYGLHVCLDIGHMLAYNQHVLADNEALLARTALVHVSAPGSTPGRASHLPLTRLSCREEKRVQGLCTRLPQSCVVMLELFDWKDIQLSFPILRRWFQG